jgi:hypothetical protein
LNIARSRQSRLSEPVLEAKGNDEDRWPVDDAAVGHIQLVTCLVEGRWVGLSEILTMLEKILRQHSIDLAVKMPYGALCRQKNPP